MRRFELLVYSNALIDGIGNWAKWSNVKTRPNEWSRWANVPLVGEIRQCVTRRTNESLWCVPIAALSNADESKRPVPIRRRPIRNTTVGTRAFGCLDLRVDVASNQRWLAFHHAQMEIDYLCRCGTIRCRELPPLSAVWSEPICRISCDTFRRLSWIKGHKSVSRRTVRATTVQK